MDFFESDFLVHAWYSYVRPMMPICHIMITSSALLITAAAFERYLTISKIRQQFSTSWRLTISFTALFIALAAKGLMYFEMEVVPRGNCTGLTAYAIDRAEWSDEEPYNTVYKFWFRNIISIFFPFFLSLYFNIKIVSRLAQQQTGARLFGYATSEHRKNIRAATRMLVLVTATYLCSNLPNVIITAWEFIDADSLYTPSVRPIYTRSETFGRAPERIRTFLNASERF
uniref:G-protein coupled receptors family 1 profile domain-containing protein n=1 Tax=Acrobeloides nanus TaxID=290746 RepID=A0A914DID3_9BILA